jgi:hypothetical protein
MQAKNNYLLCLTSNFNHVIASTLIGIILFNKKEGKWLVDHGIQLSIRSHS